MKTDLGCRMNEAHVKSISIKVVIPIFLSVGPTTSGSKTDEPSHHHTARCFLQALVHTTKARRTFVKERGKTHLVTGRSSRRAKYTTLAIPPFTLDRVINLSRSPQKEKEASPSMSARAKHLTVFGHARDCRQLIQRKRKWNMGTAYHLQKSPLLVNGNE